LIFFHFHGLKAYRNCLFVANHMSYRAPFNKLIRESIYRPYIKSLRRVGGKLNLVPQPSLTARKVTSRAGLSQLFASNCKRWIGKFAALVRGHWLVDLECYGAKITSSE
jgi:hypothetical protein